MTAEAPQPTGVHGEPDLVSHPQASALLTPEGLCPCPHLKGYLGLQVSRHPLPGIALGAPELPPAHVRTDE